MVDWPAVPEKRTRLGKDRLYGCQRVSEIEAVSSWLCEQAYRCSFEGFGELPTRGFLGELDTRNT